MAFETEYDAKQWGQKAQPELSQKPTFLGNPAKVIMLSVAIDLNRENWFSRAIWDAELSDAEFEFSDRLESDVRWPQVARFY